MTKKKSFDRQGEVWTREEIRTLRSIYRNRANAVIADVFGRTVKAVKNKASKLGLTKTKKYLRSLKKKQ